MMKYFDDQYDSDQVWSEKLANLANGLIPTDDVPGVIVRLAKPLKLNRIAAAKETILSLAKNDDFLIRRQVVWFCVWGKLTETVPLLIQLQNTENEEVVSEQLQRAIDYLSALPRTKGPTTYQPRPKA